jgi:hypothetical protein
MSYTNKTQATATNPTSYLEQHCAGNERVQKEALILIDLYTKVTGSPCVMWNKIFGFGKYYYRDSTGGEHTHLMTGFAMSKTGFTLYNILGWEAYKKGIAHLGVYKVSGKSCLAIKRVEDIDLKVLKQVVRQSVADLKKKYKTER